MTGERAIDIPAELAIFERSEDRAELERAGMALAASGDHRALARMGELLTRAEVLARLDPLDVPSQKTRRVGRILETLAQHPSAAAVELALNLATDATFLADPDRKVFLLKVLAAVEPMGDEAAALFRDANAEGYFGMNAILLAENGSPRALGLLGEMLADGSVPVGRRIDCVRFGVYPHRIEAPMLDMAGRLLAGQMENEVATALIESIFDDRPEDWFDPGSRPEGPPAWEGATTPALQRAREIAVLTEGRADLPAPLREAVRRTARRIRAILEQRES